MREARGEREGRVASLTSMKGFFFSWGSDLVNAEKGLLEGTRDRTLRERERDAMRGVGVCMRSLTREVFGSSV